MAKGFDLQVHHYSKEGRVTRANPYRLVIDSGKKEFERPVGSGLWYAEDGSLIRDESAAMRAAQEAKAAEVEAQAKAEADQAREALKAQLRAEILAEEEREEKKAVKHGTGSKT